MRMAVAGAALIASYIFADAYGGLIEGKFAPVVRDFNITRVEPAGQQRSRIWGTMDIVRWNCSPVQVSWGRENAVRVGFAELEFEEGAKSRGPGINEWGPWLVNMRPREVREESRVIVYHQCPHRFWITATNLYP